MRSGDYILVIAPENFIGTKYRNRYCYEHHLNYWKEYGVVPNKDEIIHHIDGDKHNNFPENLSLKLRSSHSTEHGLSIGRTMVELCCPSCGKIFIREKRQTYLNKNKSTYSCCSLICSGKFANFQTKEKIDKIFIREFKKYPLSI